MTGGLSLLVMMADAPRPDYSVREMEIDGEITLFHTKTRAALVLNTTASDVWRLLNGARTADDIAKILEERYAADSDTVRAGVESALVRLREHGLLAESDESA